MNTTSWGKIAVRVGSLLALHACGGDGGGSVGPVPDGLSVRMGEVTVESGSLAIDLKDVPVHSVFWAQQLGSGVQNVVGSAQLNIVSTAPNGLVGPPLLYPTVEGDGAEAFKLILDDQFGSNFLVYVQCIPPGPGEYEAALISTVTGASGRHVTRMRCSTAEGYAMIPGQLMPGAVESDELLFVGGGRVNRKTFETREPLSYPDFGSWEYWVGPITRDGSTLPFLWQEPSPYVTPSADYHYYSYDLTTGKVRAVLTAEEGAALASQQTGVPKMNTDGTQLFFADARGIHRKVVDGALTDFAPAMPPAGTLGTYHVVSVPGDGRYVVYAFSNMISQLSFDALWVLDTESGTSTPFAFVDAQGAPLAGAPTWVTELVFTPDMRYVAAGTYNQGVISLWLYDRDARTLTPLFERAKRHVATLRGMAGTIMLAGGLTLSADGKLATLLINDYTSAEYWAGPKGVYVTETDTGKTYSFGVLPDGKPLSGDGWNYTAAGLSVDGNTAHASVFWSGGVSGDAIGPFTLFVPRDRWQEIPE